MARTDTPDDDEATRSAETDGQVRAYLDAWSRGDEVSQRNALNKILHDGADNVDDALPSTATDAHIRTYLDAWRDGDDAGQKDALNGVVRTWRADNAAGGVPVYAHLPLPAPFARILTHLADGVGEVDRRQPFESIAAKLDPSVRALVRQQFAASTGENRNERKQTSVDENGGGRWSTIEAAGHELRRLANDLTRIAPKANGGTYGAFGRAVQNTFVLGVPTNSSRAANARRSQYGEPDYDGGDDADWLQQPGLARVPGTAIVRGRPLDGYPPQPRHKPGPRVPGAHPKYQPGDWYQLAPQDYSDDPAHPDVRYAMTDSGKVLVSPYELTKAQQDNLLGRKGIPGTGRPRRWITPTDTMPGDQQLSQGFGFFGASRKGTRRRHHGGADFTGTEVRMPTDARLIGLAKIYKLDKYGNKVLDANGEPIHYGYTLTFDLGDGMQLSLLHVKPSQALLDRWEEINGKGGRFQSAWIPLGTPLGEPDTTAYDRKNDHVHMQITMEGGTFNGALVRGFAVDPTPLFPERDDPSWYLEMLRAFGLAD